MVEALHRPEADAEPGRDLPRTGGAAVVDRHVLVEPVLGEHGADGIEVTLDVERVPERFDQCDQRFSGCHGRTIVTPG